MEQWVTKALVDYAVSTQFEDFPPEVIEMGRRLLLDNIGCALGGSQSPIGESIMGPAKRMGGAFEATLIGGGLKVPVVQAALVNGTNANALDFDDAYLSSGIGHPGSSLIPAALAVGELKNASGREILTAVITGYEVGNRIGLAIQPTYERLQEVWGVGTWQTFGAVTAAGKVLGLNTDRMLNAFGIAGATAPLPNTQKWGWDLSERPIHWVKEPTGWPSWTGTMAATLAETGFIGNRFILDGRNGFWIMAGSDQCDFESMTRGLGERYVVTNDMSFKPYSCCRWQHPALDAVRSIMMEHGTLAEEVETLTVHSFSWVKSQEVYDPVSVVDAQFCIPFTTAMVLLGTEPGPGWYTESNLADPVVKSLAGKVKVVVDPELDRRYSRDGELTARVEILTRSGEKLSAFVDTPSGDPSCPPSLEDLEKKFRNQAAGVLTREKIDTAVEMIGRFDELEDMGELMDILMG